MRSIDTERIVVARGGRVAEQGAIGFMVWSFHFTRQREFCRQMVVIVAQ